MDYLNSKNCKRLTGFAFDEILSLTGIFGIHNKAQLLSAKYGQADIEGKIVNIEFETDLLEEFVVRIDLREKNIKIEKFISTGKEKELTFRSLISLVENAVKLGFKKIILDAYGGKGAEKKYTGFFVWAKYGFRMSSAKDRKFFKEKMIELNRKELSIFELVHTPDGLELWIEHGKDWLGEFNLSPNSISMKNFKKIRKTKGL
ncbi:MAG: hypothetical protein JST86_00955 [Bacteroidetes bacterium]|nr:hypothetical protein [Bacteroidota bacterium]